jgi:hypothetical protein
MSSTLVSVPVLPEREKCHPTCDICFYQVAPQDVYSLPCACKLTICWGCMYIQRVVSGKTSQCPSCRQATRYEVRHSIMVDNYKSWRDSPRRFFGCRHWDRLKFQTEIDLVDNKLTHQVELDELEDVIISINYLYLLDPQSTCLKALRLHPSMTLDNLPIWARPRPWKPFFSDKLSWIYACISQQTFLPTR